MFEYSSATNKLTTLVAFDDADGNGPSGSLTPAANGVLYGLTSSGGADGYGTAYQLVTNDSFEPTGSATAAEPGPLTLCVAALSVGAGIGRRRKATRAVRAI